MHIDLPVWYISVLVPSAHAAVHVAMKTDRNGQKNLISTFVSIFFGGNGIGFGKYGFGNGIEIRGCTKTNKY
jgi:hypothetical protein